MPHSWFAFCLLCSCPFWAHSRCCSPQALRGVQALHPFQFEYEYIVTNGTMDIDKIINKSSRKRILSFELATVSRIEKFNPAQLSGVNAKELFITCNQDDPGAYLMVSATEGKGTSYLVFAPDERVRSAIVKFVPKFISNSAFK
ncbi:MAG: DUF6106 family protein [Oscillospiraceae bacterium]